MKPTKEQIEAVARIRAGGVWATIGEGTRAALEYNAKEDIEAWERVKQEQADAEWAEEERKAEEKTQALEEYYRLKAARQAKDEAARQAETLRIEAERRAATDIAQERMNREWAELAAGEPGRIEERISKAKREAAELATERAKIEAEQNAIAMAHMQKCAAETAERNRREAEAAAAAKAKRDEEARKADEANSKRVLREIAEDLGVLSVELMERVVIANAICDGKIRNVQVVW